MEWRVVAILVSCVIVGGCEANRGNDYQDRISRAAVTDYLDDAQCRGQGFKEDTPTYTACRKGLMAARNQPRDWLAFAD